MIRQAAGDFILPARADLIAQGHAIEARLYAEDPACEFRPSTGLLTETMKMEMEITAPVAGRVHEILCQIGRVVQAGQRLAVLQSV